MLHPAIREMTTTSAAALLVVVPLALPIAPFSRAMAAPGVVGNAAAKVGGVVGALGSGAGSAAAGPAGAAAGGSGAGIGGAAGGGGAGAGGASGGASGAASGGTGASGAGGATIVAAAGLGDMADAELVGRAFLASPVATHVAAGRNARNTVVIKAVYTDAAGRPCRVVEQTVMIDGQAVRASGNICLMRGGQWALVP